MVTNLMTNGTANASGVATRVGPGKVVAFFYGTWDTATLTLEVSPDGGTTWIAQSAQNSDALYEFTAYSDLKYRATLSSVGVSTDVSLKVVANAFPFSD